MKKIIFICLLCIFTAGCKDKAPDCSAEQTQKVVKGIIHDQFINQFTKESVYKQMGMSPEQIEQAKHNTYNALKEKGIDLNAITVNLNTIRTIEEYDNGSCLCKAEVSLKGYMPNNSGEMSYSIKYTSELTDNGDDFLVTIYND